MHGLVRGLPPVTSKPIQPSVLCLKSTSYCLFRSRQPSQQSEANAGARMSQSQGQQEPQPHIRAAFFMGRVLHSLASMIHLLHFCWQEGIKHTRWASSTDTPGWFLPVNVLVPIRTTPRAPSSTFGNHAGKIANTYLTLFAPFSTFCCFKCRIESLQLNLKLTGPFSGQTLDTR